MIGIEPCIQHLLVSLYGELVPV